MHDVRAALAHSESSTKRVYSRRGMTDDEKKAHNRSMFSQEAYAFCERLHSDEVPVSSFHKKLDEAGYKPLHTSPKFTVRIVEQVFGDWKQAKGGARPVEKSATTGNNGTNRTVIRHIKMSKTHFMNIGPNFFTRNCLMRTGQSKNGLAYRHADDEMVDVGSEFSSGGGKSKLQEIANAMKFEDLRIDFGHYTSSHFPE